MKYNVVTNDRRQESVTAFHDGKEFVATKDHPRFGEIIAALDAKDDPSRIIGLFDLSTAVAGKFDRLSERILVRGGSILLDGETVDGPIAPLISGLFSQKVEDWQPLVNFLENLANNPQKHSRDQLFRWLMKNKFSIDSDGNIIAYKGVNKNTGLGDDEYEFLSSTSGTAIVNGVWYKNKKIPTNPNTIVEMPRSAVDHDPRAGCSTGLHAGDWSYASGFTSGPTLRVQINPRDVVSVPTDSGERKIRVCRYRVLSPVTAPDTETLLTLDEKDLMTRAMDSKPAKKKKAASTKKKAASTKKKAASRPKYYEDFKKADFVERPMQELQWLVKEWELTPNGRTKASLVESLYRAAAARRKKDLKPSDKVKTK